MFNYLPSPLLGVVSLLLYVVNTVCVFAAMVPVILIKLIVPHAGVRIRLTRFLMFLGTVWVDINSYTLWLTQKIKWDVSGIEGLNVNDSYLVISNHRSWTDILVLQHLFNHRIPFLKFFLKKELFWVPVMGLAWWALDFPYMKRYSRQFIAKHPELRGKDMETTRKYCEKFKNSPVSVINFLEGTRFSDTKHDKQKSPFPHLLLPKAGGVAIVLSSMGEYLSKIVDVTIVYPENKPPVDFWHFLRGDIHFIIVRVRVLPVPEDFIGKNYEDDNDVREEFKQWVNQLWQEKDRQIEKILIEHGVP
ncbi:MAG: acyltransferase [Dissulfuribacterales bacterium]